MYLKLTFASVVDQLTVLVPFQYSPPFAAVTVTVGAVLSTVKVPLGPAPAAEFPAVSEAVPEAIVIFSVPSPVILEMVTTLVDDPLPETAFDPAAFPVDVSVTFPAASVTAFAPE